MFVLLYDRVAEFILRELVYHSWFIFVKDFRTCFSYLLWSFYLISILLYFQLFLNIIITIILIFQESYLLYLRYICFIFWFISLLVTYPLISILQQALLTEFFKEHIVYNFWLFSFLCVLIFNGLMKGSKGYFKIKYLAFFLFYFLFLLVSRLPLFLYYFSIIIIIIIILKQLISFRNFSQ